MTENEMIARKTIEHYMLWSAGAALIPIPFVDMIALAGVQLKMLAEISKVYGIPFERSRVKGMVVALGGYVVPHTLSVGLFGSLFKSIPGVGALAGIPSFVLFSAAYTWAVGRVFIQHFESGGTFLDFDPEAVKEHFRAQFEEGRKVASTMRTEDKAEV